MVEDVRGSGRTPPPVTRRAVPPSRLGDRVTALEEPFVHGGDDGRGGLVLGDLAESGHGVRLSVSVSVGGETQTRVGSLGQLGLGGHVGVDGPGGGVGDVGEVSSRIQQANSRRIPSGSWK